MDRRSSYPYSRRSQHQRSYGQDDAVLPSFNDSDDSGNNDEDNNDDEDYRGHRFRHQIPTRHPRKHRKLSTLNYHFTPTPTPTPAETPNWSDQATFVLLEIWGDRFLQLGRSSLRSDDWSDVAERVSQATRSKLEVSDCRNRLNVLKAKYKREKVKWGGLGGGISKWVFYKKMDGLMTMSPRQLQQQEQCGLACGVDSGEFVFMNPRVYLDHSNALDEMRDSPGNSESGGSDEDEDEESGDEDEEGDDEEDEVEAEESYRLLSESIQRVGQIYEKIEDSKRHHMMELERMRAEFQRDLEVHKKEMLDRTTAEIEKLCEKGDQSSNCSAENVLGE